MRVTRLGSDWRNVSQVRPQATPTVQSENERVKVTEWHFSAAAETGWHRHEYDYVIVPLASGRLLIEASGGSSISELLLGKSYFRRSGVEHNVVNANEGEFAFLEVELKP